MLAYDGSNIVHKTLGIGDHRPKMCCEREDQARRMQAEAVTWTVYYEVMPEHRIWSAEELLAMTPAERDAYRRRGE